MSTFNVTPTPEISDQAESTSQSVRDALAGISSEIANIFRRHRHPGGINSDNDSTSSPSPMRESSMPTYSGRQQVCAIIRGELDKGNWLVVEWQSAPKRLPFEMTKPCHSRLEETVRTAISVGAADVVASCKRRDDARFLARAWRLRLSQIQHS